MSITATYAALCALLVLFLAARVSLARRSAHVGIGDGGDRLLLRRIRAHANAVESIPIALLLLLVLELARVRPTLLHVFGVTLVVGRVLHAIGLSRSGGTTPERFIGTALTWLDILAMSLLVLWRVFGG